MNTPQKICLGALIIFLGLWLALYATYTNDGFYNYLFSFLFGLIPLFGGLTGMWYAKSWGGFKAAIGKAIFFIALGLFLWGCGETVWSYYNFFLNIPAPYPSLADLGFAPSIFFYGVGALYLSKVTGAKFGFRSSISKFLVGVGSLLISVLSYYVLVIVARSGVIIPGGEGFLKSVLDVAYPLGDLLALLIAGIISGLSFQYLGGTFRRNIIMILCGLAIMFVGDSVFSYTTTVGTYYNADFGDLLLMFGLFSITYGILGFYRKEQI